MLRHSSVITNMCFPLTDSMTSSFCHTALLFHFTLSIHIWFLLLLTTSFQDNRTIPADCWTATLVHIFHLINLYFYIKKATVPCLFTSCSYFALPPLFNMPTTIVGVIIIENPANPEGMPSTVVFYVQLWLSLSQVLRGTFHFSLLQHCQHFFYEQGWICHVGSCVFALLFLYYLCWV